MKRIAIAGAGDVAKYVMEEARARGHFVVVLSREPREWFTANKVETRVTDYTFSSLLSCIQDVDILISLLHDNSSFFVSAHLAMIEACSQSPSRPRFIPSECGGNIDDFPTHPLFYLPTHVPIREKLKQQKTIEYVLVNNGWFMDYFIPSSQSYMKRLGVVWPLDLEEEKDKEEEEEEEKRENNGEEKQKQKRERRGKIRIPGDGNVPVSFTAARDVAKAMIRLVEIDKWEDRHIYVAGDTMTWNEIKTLIERLKGIQLEVTYNPTEAILKTIEDNKTEKDAQETKDLWLAYMDLWNANGAAGIPEDKKNLQRQKYFQGIKFRTVEELIEEGKSKGGIL